MPKNLLFKLFLLLLLFSAKQIQAQSGVGVGEINPQGKFHVSQPYIFAGVSFSGAGTLFNNLTANISGFNGTAITTYIIRIQNAGPNPNIIETSSDGGATFSTPAPISNPVVLANGVTATFGTTGSHAFGDQWTFSAGPSFNNTLVVKDGKIGVGTITTNNSAILDINSNSKGILISRLTTLQKNGIPSPAAGLLVYQTDSVTGFYFYNGISWLNLATSVAGPNSNFTNQTLSNLSTPTAVNRSLIPVSNDSVSLGNTAKGWEDLFMSGGVYNGSNRIIYVDTLKANAFFGTSAASNNTSGIRNIAIGSDALSKNISGQANIAIGTGALFNNTTSNFVAIGDSALFNQKQGGAGFNSAIGYRALYSNTTGAYNTAIGNAVLRKNTIASQNTATGVYAMEDNITGFNNTAMGFLALSSNINGTNNIANGSQALNNNTSGTANTAIGVSALSKNTTAEFNTALGYFAGTDFINGYNNVFLGANADVTSAGLFNTIVIGQSASGTASSQVTVGNGASNSYRAYANWTNISDGRYKKNIQQNVPGLSFINKLKAVTYNLDATGLDAFINHNKMTDSAAYFYRQALAEKEKNVYTGFIAQDVEQAAKEANFNFSGVDAPKNSKDVYGLRYAEFVVPLVKAVQELSAQNEDLKKQNTRQLEINENLQQRLAKLELLIKKN